MTTWQEDPPMSRRALRESERAHAQATLSRDTEVTAEEPVADQQIWSQAPGPEPLHYTTQGRLNTPGYDGQSFRTRQGSSAQPSTETPAYRLRDFSPEARGTSFTATQPAPSVSWTPSPAGSGDLDYHTSVEADRPGPTASAAPVAAPPKLGTHAVADVVENPARSRVREAPSEFTLSRRELRALRNAAAPVVDDRAAPENVAPAVSVPSVAPVSIAPVPLVVQSQPLPPVAPKPDTSAEVEAAMAEFDALYHLRSTPDTARSGGPEAAPAARQSSELHTLVEPATPQPRAPEPVAPPVAISSPSTTLPAAGEPIREVVTAPEVYTRPIGHWSTQAGIDDENQVTEHTLSRNLAASDAITTSALVLPSFPQAGPFTGPVSGTGEILITGSIDLPRSLGMSGRYPSRYDSPDVDSIVDAADREDSAPDSAPVRAIRAVSTHTSSQGIIATKRPKGNNLPVILSITAGVMAVSVVVLFVAGMIFKIF